MKVHKRIWRISIGSAMVISAPVLLLCAWGAWTAYANLDVYRRAAYPSRDLSLDDFHLSFHDLLNTWSNNLLSSNSNAKSDLPKLRLHLKNAQLQAITSDHPGTNKYVDGILSRAKKNIHIKIRQRGHRHWHYLGVQRSVKLKFGKDGGRQGLKALALINEPTPFFITNVLIANVAKKYGLLTPEPDFVRVWMNGANMGIYRRQIMADEAMLRKNDRYPCNLYSGDLDAHEPAKTLWTNAGSWKKSAWCSGRKDSMDDLERLLAHIASDSFQEFSNFANDELALERFAALDALEIVFAIGQRDWRQGHKLVHDIGSEKWEPVAWSLRGFADTSVFKPSTHPLGIRLEMVPGYISLRNRILHEMLMGPARPSVVRSEGLNLFRKLLPELITDSHWDAYELAPDEDPFLYKMLRPMDEKKLSLVFDSVMASYAIRYSRIMEELERVNVVGTVGSCDKENSWPIAITVSGRVGISIESIQVEFADKHQHPWSLKEEGKQIQRSAEQVSLVLPEAIRLFPSIELANAPNKNSEYSPLTTKPMAVTYHMEIKSSARPLLIHIVGKNLATSSRVILEIDFSQERSSNLCGQENIASDKSPSMTAGQGSAHPWSYDRPLSSQEVIIGPGDLHVDQSMTYGPSQKVRIQAGTRFLMGKDASLVFLGPVQIQGTAKRPVRMEADGDHDFGGMIIYGAHTAGSRIEGLHTRGGTAPVFHGEKLRGTISIYKTNDILLTNCIFEDNSDGVDLVHVSDVTALKLRQVTIKKAAQDALDLEFSEASISGLEIFDSSDESIDLMGSKIKIIDSVLNSAGGSNISAGERSTVTVRASVLSHGKTGLLVKNSSAARFFSSLVYACHTGLQVKAASRYYPRGSRLDAQDITIAACDTHISSQEKKSQKRSAKISLRNMFFSLNDSPFMDRIRKDILGMARWSDLDSTLGKLSAKQGRP